MWFSTSSQPDKNLCVCMCVVWQAVHWQVPARDTTGHIQLCRLCAHLFSSHHKCESGCGWPAFSDVLSSAAVNLTPDHSYGLSSTLYDVFHAVLSC